MRSFFSISKNHWTWPKMKWNMGLLICVKCYVLTKSRFLKLNFSSLLHQLQSNSSATTWTKMVDINRLNGAWKHDFTSWCLNSTRWFNEKKYFQQIELVSVFCKNNKFCKGKGKNWCRLFVLKWNLWNREIQTCICTFFNFKMWNCQVLKNYVALIKYHRLQNTQMHHRFRMIDIFNWCKSNVYSNFTIACVQNNVQFI